MAAVTRLSGQPEVRLEKTVQRVECRLHPCQRRRVYAPVLFVRLGLSRKSTGGGRAELRRGNRQLLKKSNCSPLLGCGLGVVQFDHVGGLSGKRDLDGDERIVPECRH